MRVIFASGNWWKSELRATLSAQIVSEYEPTSWLLPVTMLPSWSSTAAPTLNLE